MFLISRCTPEKVLDAHILDNLMMLDGYTAVQISEFLDVDLIEVEKALNRLKAQNLLTEDYSSREGYKWHMVR